MASCLRALGLALAVALEADVRPQGVVSDVDGLIAAGAYDEAERSARDAIPRATPGTSAAESAGAVDALLRALIANGRAASAETRLLAERALALRDPNEPTPGARVPALLNLTAVLTAAAEYDRAIAAGRRAVAHCDTPAGRPDLPLALDHLGRALSAARRYDDALAILQRSLGMRERAGSADGSALASTLEDIGLVLQRKGEYERSRPLLERAEALRVAAGARHPAYATTLNLLAQQRWFEGDVLGSKALSERAVALAEDTLRPEHPVVALSVRYLAATLGDLGESAQSLSLTRRALALAERNFGPDHHVTAEYRNDLGFAELDQGDYVGARRTLQQALRIYEQRYGTSHEYVATTLSVLARADARLGDYERARRDQARAVAIYARVGGARHPFVATALTELAEVYRDQGQPAAAAPLLERALTIREQTLGVDHRDVARTLADLAASLLDLGQAQRAQALAARALDIWRRVDVPDAPDYATVLALSAQIRAGRGDFAAAREALERALQIRGRVFGPSHPIYAATQADLSVALAHLGERDAALAAAAQAEAAGRDHLQLLLRSLPERQGLQYAAARPRGLNVIAALGFSTPAAAPIALDAVIRSRALVFDEMAVRQGRARAAAERGDPVRRALRLAQQRLANLNARSSGQMTPAQYRAVRDAAARDRDAAEQSLAAASAEFRAERSQARLGLDDVRRALPSDGALVSFVRYDRLAFELPERSSATPGRQRRERRPTPAYLAIVLRASGAPVLVALDTADRVDGLVARWRQDIAAEWPATAPAAAATPAASSRGSGAALRRAVWDRIQPHLGDARHIFIVPDGTLNFVPFDALPVGARSYLVERPAILHYLSAERDLVAPPAAAPAAARGLLALGGPAFDENASWRSRRARGEAAPTASPAARLRDATLCTGIESVRFAPLPGTLAEVRELARLWDANRAASGSPAQVLVGAAANESRFKRDAHQYRVLHLATHGFFADGACPAPVSGLRGVGGLAAVRRSSAAENPLLLSGLALAGANRRSAAGPEEDDGILMAEEVTSLDLAGVELAVLSACETGIGEIRSGEGVVGLRRAFQLAGARAIVMSLWPVEDDAARTWMRRFYRSRFQARLALPESVRAAQLEVLRQRRARGLSDSPFYWAGFVAAGDWR